MPAGRTGKVVMTNEVGCTEVPVRVAPNGGKLLVVTTRALLKDPANDGENVTGSVIEAPALTTSFIVNPVTANGGSVYTLSIVRPLVPVFCKTTFCAVLVVPSGTLLKLREVLLKLPMAPGSVPVPVIATTTGANPSTLTVKLPE